VSKGLKNKYPDFGFGSGKRLYWPSPRLTALEIEAGWAPCSEWKTCKDVAAGFVPGFPHSHKAARK
jgi:hypothetical protein